MSKESLQEKIENNLLKILHNILLCEFGNNKNSLQLLNKLDDLVKDMEVKKLAYISKEEEKRKVFYVNII